MSAETRFERRMTALATQITAAATAYEARWTLAALARVEPDIHSRMQRQIALWATACRGDDDDEIVTQGEALVRGYRRAIEVMTTAGAEDDAYMLGSDEASGLRIAIGHQVAAADRVAALYPDAVWLSPDEVAGILHSLDGFRFILEAKRHFPAAVTMPQRPEHGA